VTLLDFGQPANGVVQMAYLVPDLEQAIAHWVDVLHAGPFFVTDRFVGADAHYRGRKTDVAIAVAMGFSGHMQIELIQALDDEASIYRETLDRQGPGFHHFGIVSADLERDIEKYGARGYELAVRGKLPGTPHHYAYLDTKGQLPGFIELIPAAVIPMIFIPIFRASIGWSGKDPIRRAGR
jgi:hypothetical protein